MTKPYQIKNYQDLKEFIIESFEKARLTSITELYPGDVIMMKSSILNDIAVIGIVHSVLQIPTLEFGRNTTVLQLRLYSDHENGNEVTVEDEDSLILLGHQDPNCILEDVTHANVKTLELLSELDLTDFYPKKHTSPMNAPETLIIEIYNKSAWMYICIFPKMQIREGVNYKRIVNPQSEKL